MISKLESEVNIMKQIIKLIDVDVDGCGTNVETMIQVEGKHELTKRIFKGINDTIQKYKKECDGEYDTDNIVETVCEYLENKGYMCYHISEDVAIEF